MAKVEIKQPIVDEIAGYLADAQAMVLVDYRGLTVEEDTQLRKALREAGVDYKVYKNTLIKRAVKGNRSLRRPNSYRNKRFRCNSSSKSII